PINERAKPGGVGGALAGGAGGGGAGGTTACVVTERVMILAERARKQAGDTTLLPGALRWPSSLRFSFPPPSTCRAGASASTGASSVGLRSGRPPSPRGSSVG